jgi:molybdopterin-binding protein
MLIYIAGPLVIAAVSQETKIEIIDGKLVTSTIGTTTEGLTRIEVGSQNIH